MKQVRCSFCRSHGLLRYWGTEENGRKIKKPEIILENFSALSHNDEVDDEDSGTRYVQNVDACLYCLTSEPRMQSSHSFSFLATNFMQVEWFNAEKHVEFIRKSMASAGVENMKDFALCQISKSTNLDPKIARLLGFPHIGCHNHSFSGAREDMDKASISLADTIETTKPSTAK